MKPEIFATVMDFFNSGLPVVHEGAEISGDTEIYDDDDDTVQMIKVLFPFNNRHLLHKNHCHPPSGAFGHPDSSDSAGRWGGYCLHGI